MKNSKLIFGSMLFTAFISYSVASAQTASDVTPSATPKPTKKLKKKVKKAAKPHAKASPSPSPTPEPSVSPSPIPEPSPTPVATPTPTPVAEVAPTPTPAPVVAAPVATPTPADHSNDRYGKLNRPLGDFLVGPYITALALPRPFSAGLEIKYWDLIGLSSSYGFFPQTTISSNVKLKITGWDVKAKIYPLRGAFFIGVGIGDQTFTGSTTQTDGASETINLTQTNFFIAPQIGWNWIWESGIFMGVDLGVQLSMSRHTSISTTVTDPTVLASAQYAKSVSDLSNQADIVGKTPLPVLTLLKIGYFF